jgi:hypothetical protein
MNLIARLLCLLLLVGLCLSAQPYQVKTTIPFQFEAANLVLPAGEYSIERMPDAINLAVLRLENRTARAYLISFPMALANNTEKVRPQLVVRRFGNGTDSRYFLSEFWTTAGGSRLLKTRAEQEAESAVMVAGQRPETVVIFARR